MNFQPGDKVVVIAVQGAHYPADAVPGTIATIEHLCGCAVSLLTGVNHWRITVATRSVCAPEPVLRKIDSEDRQVVKWDIVPWQPAHVRTPA